MMCSPRGNEVFFDGFLFFLQKNKSKGCVRKCLANFDRVLGLSIL